MRVCLNTILIIIHLNLNCDLVIMNKQTSFMHNIQRKKKYGNLIQRSNTYFWTLDFKYSYDTRVSKCLYSIDEVYGHAPDVCMQSHFLSVVYSCVFFACFDVNGILISSTKITTFVEFQ